MGLLNNLNLSKTDKFFVILIGILLFRLFFYKETKSDFKAAVKGFVFGLLSFKHALIVIFILSVLIPFAALVVIFHDLYSSKVTASMFINDVICHHIKYCLYAGIAVYVVDILNDFKILNSAERSSTNMIAGAESSDLATGAAGLNVWIKYIFHFIFTPILFVDGIYSIELQKLDYYHEDSTTNVTLWVYILSQFFLGSYLVYGICIVLYFDNQLINFWNAITNLSPADLPADITVYFQKFSEYFIEVIIITILFGLFDQKIKMFKNIFSISIDTLLGKFIQCSPASNKTVNQS